MVKISISKTLCNLFKFLHFSEKCIDREMFTISLIYDKHVFQNSLCIFTLLYKISKLNPVHNILFDIKHYNFYFEW